MPGLEVALLTIAASVALRVDDARSVSVDDQAAISTALGEAIAARSGLEWVVDKGDCRKKERCYADVAERTRSDDVVFLRLLGVPTRIRIIAERVKLMDKKTAEIDLPRPREAWGPALASLAEQLFEARALPVVATAPPADKTPIDLTTPAPKPDDTVAWAPWVAIGAGAVALAVGSGFGLSSRGARREALARMHTDEENEALEDRAIGHALAADILFGVAAIGIGTGVVLLAIE